MGGGGFVRVAWRGGGRCKIEVFGAGRGSERFASGRWSGRRSGSRRGEIFASGGGGGGKSFASGSGRGNRFASGSGGSGRSRGRGECFTPGGNRRGGGGTCRFFGFTAFLIRVDGLQRSGNWRVPVRFVTCVFRKRNWRGSLRVVEHGSEPFDFILFWICRLRSCRLRTCRLRIVSLRVCCRRAQHNPAVRIRRLRTCSLRVCRLRVCRLRICRLASSRWAQHNSAVHRTGFRGTGCRRFFLLLFLFSFPLVLRFFSSLFLF